MKAGGVSLVRLMVPVLLVSGLLAGGMIVFNDRLLPESNHELRKLLTDIGQKQPTFELRERVINEVVRGELFLQAARIDRGRSVLHDLAIFDVGRPDITRTIYADSGHMAFNAAGTDLYLTLYDGSMLERDVNDPSSDQRTYYASQVIRVPGVTNELERGRSTDFRGDREMNIAMMREEVRQRRERMAQLEDSLSALTPQLRPTRTARADESIERIPIDQEGDSAAGSPGLRPRKLERPAPRQLPERERESIAATPSPSQLVKMQQLRRARGAVWPPQGDAAQFASVMRSEFDRLAQRYDLHRREVNRYAVEIEKKFAIPVAAIVFVLIGAPIGVRFPRGGIGMVIGVSLAVFCVYYVFLIGGEEFADRDFLSPFWAMWGPNVLFGVVGCLVIYVVSREGTSRMAAMKRRVRRLLGMRRESRATGLRTRHESA
jgi:lipopolysaccharide export system permease protein